VIRGTSGDSLILVVASRYTFADAIAARLAGEHDLRASAATSLATARRRLAELTHHLVLIDAGLGQDAGLGEGAGVGRLDCGPHALRLLRELPGVRGRPAAVMLGGPRDEPLAAIAIRSGARGWLSTDARVGRLVATVRGVLSGETWVPPRLLTRVLADLAAHHERRDDATRRVMTLTLREREILTHLADGRDCPTIASLLQVTPGTVRTHIRNLLRKLGVPSSLAAAAVARCAGLNSGLDSWYDPWNGGPDLRVSAAAPP
jgi:DNA-binding NarL/FixJ family response regulator